MTNTLQGCRISSMNLPSGDTSNDDRTNRRNGTGSYFYAWANHGARCHPGAVRDRDSFRRDRKRRVGPVMVSGAQIRALRQTNVVADGDLSPVVDPAVFADPTILADAKSPGITHLHLRADPHRAADLGAEQFEKSNTATGRKEPDSNKRR